MTDLDGLLDLSPDGMAVVADDGVVLWANPAARALLDLAPDAATTLCLPPPPGSGVETALSVGDGSVVVEARSTPIEWRGRRAHLTVLRDVTVRHEAEQARTEDAERLRLLLEHSPIYIFFKDENIRSLQLSRNYETMLGRPLSELLGKNMNDLFPSDLARSMVADDQRVLAEGRPVEVEEELEGRTYVTTKFPIQRPGKPPLLAGFTQDITERRRAEAERGKLEEQLLQSQKMESVGRLAGGVAHDFNNMLLVILGQAELAMQSLAPDHPVQDELHEILAAGRRSADLTRQLLAFARKQIVSPRPLDLNDTVASMLKMLRRLIGEDIDLAWKPGPGLGQITMDPTQLDQILANLTVNARDAMPGAGTLTIKTLHRSLKSSEATGHPGLPPGDYAELSISDTGHGMDEETRSHLFEPFFTTKGVGQGTGLGLATVYGIVSQNGGAVDVDSAPGRGTTIRILLPSTAVPLTAEAPEAAPPSTRGTETVLIVEDEPSVLELATTILRHEGYTVLTACTPALAIDLLRRYEGPLHLLVTDVVLPGMDGRALRDQVLDIRPGIRVLFMSGYTSDVVAHRGVLDDGIRYLQKPFSIRDLAVRVRQLLDED